jgi:acetyl esterase/lipase
MGCARSRAGGCGAVPGREDAMQSTSAWPRLAWVSWAFLALNALGLWCTWSAFRPPHRPAFWRMPGFFMSWLSGELPLHHLAFQVALVLGFVWSGALEHRPGQLALLLGLASCAGLVALALRPRRAAPVLEAALAETLGPDYRARIAPGWTSGMDQGVERARLLLPCRHRDPRVERIADVAYGPAGVRNRLDLYRPARAPGPHPLLLQVHGGGWVYGQKEHQALPLLYHLAAHGWLCAAINYRLSPAATFPEHLIDVKRAIAWLRERGKELGADPGFIAITGGSAGGHLAALAALTPADPEYQPGFEGADTALQACVPLYAPYDLVDRHGVQNDPAMQRLVERQFLKCALARDREAWEKASPLARVRRDAPPFFVIHGAADSLAYAPGARIFVAALRAAGAAPVVHAELPEAQHAFDTFQSVRAQQNARAIQRFLAYHYSLHLRERRG